MITPFVMRVFDRLANAAILDVARRATPSPPPSLVDSFMEEAFKLDSDMRSAYEDAKRDDATRSADEPSKKEMFRGDFERILEGIANGATSSAKAVSNGDITHLMNMIRFLQRKREGGNDRETKAVGMRETLQGFREGLSKANTRDSTAKKIVAFVEEAFAGEMGWLMNAYLYSRKRGGDLKINLLTQDAGGRDKGKELARMTILGLLLEGTRNSIEKELYANHSTDGGALGAIASGVHHRINNRQTGDMYDDETAVTEGGGKYSRGKWGKYIAPLQDTGKFGHGESLDIIGITEFLNDNFLRPDLDSRTPVDAALPGGGTMTAPSFKTKLKNSDVHLWATGASSGISMDMPAGSGENPGTLGDTLGAPDAPPNKMEEYAIKYLNSPVDSHAMEKLKLDIAQTDEGERILEGVHTNKDLLRAKLRGWVDEAAAIGTVRDIKAGPGTRQEVSKDNKDAIRDIVLIKFGFMSEGHDREDFKRRWLDGQERVPKYYASPMSNDDWSAIGKPLKKIRGKSDVPRKFYEKDWKQSALLNKETGQPPDNTPEILKNPDAFKLITVTHKKGEAADPRHLVEWHKYSRKQREADLDRGLDIYGHKWFEQSISDTVLDELRESHGDLADVLEKFSPEKIFVSVAKTTDQEMARAMGFIRPTIAPQANTLHPNYPALQAGIKAVVKNLAVIMGERKGEDEISVLNYMGLKRLGRIASVIT